MKIPSFTKKFVADKLLIQTAALTLSAGLLIMPCSSALATTFNVKAYGATDDGSTDDGTAINAAITAAANAGGGTVLIPSGVYLLGTPLGSYHSFLTPRSQVDIQGEGDASVLKVANGMNDISPFGWYVFGPLSAGEVVNNVTFSKFKVDCNGANNLETAARNHKDAAIWIATGSNITIDALSVVNNAGRQCFSLTGITGAFTIYNATIQNCRIDTVGAAVPGNTLQNDHSAIYVRGDHCVVAYNILTNPVQDNSSTAIEIHASNSDIRGNVISKFSTGINIVATTIAQQNTSYACNFITGVNRALSYHTDGYSLQNINVANNAFAGGTVYPVIDADTNVVSSFGSGTIQGNIILCSSQTMSADRGSGIRAGKDATLLIRNNVFQNLRGRAVELGAGTPTSLTIENNNIVDCCQTTDTSYQRAIELNNTGTIANLSIRYNEIRNTGTNQWMDGGIHGNVDLGTAVFEKNQLLNLRSYEIKWENTRSGQSVGIGSLLVTHFGNVSPSGTVRASVGSLWIDLSSGWIWKKTSGGTTTSGWVSNQQSIYASP